MGPISRGLQAQRQRLMILQGFSSWSESSDLWLSSRTTSGFVAAASYPCVNASSFHSSGFQRRRYSSRVTSTAGDDGELQSKLKGMTKPTSLDDSSSRSANLLVAAAQREAERILSSKEQDEEEEESEATLKQTAAHLLTLTIRTKLLSLALEHQKDQKAIKAMQRAFIMLVSACLKKKSDAAFTGTALNLTRRAHTLALPFPLPVYRNLVTAIANHLKDPASLIPEVCTIPQKLLQTKLDPSFFSDALLILVKRGFFGEVLELHEEILFRFHVDAFSEPKVAMAIVTLVRERVMRHLATPKNNRILDGDAGIWLDEAMELSDRTYRALEDCLGGTTGPFRDANKMMELMEWLDRNMDDIDRSKRHNHFPDYDSDDEDDYDADYDEEEESYTIDGGNEFHGPRIFHLNDSKKGDESDKAPTDSWDRDDNDDDNNYEEDDRDSLLDEVAKRHIYLRDTDTFRLPDVTAQFRDLSGGTDVLYSRKFEAHVLDRLRGDDEEDDGPS